MFFVRMTTPPFDALYALPPSVPSSPSMLAMFTIEPRWPRRIGLLVDHLRDDVLVGEERALEVDVDDPVPLAGIDEVHRTTSGDAGRVHERVDPTVLGRDGRDRCTDRGFVAHVENDVVAVRRGVEPDDRRALGSRVGPPSRHRSPTPIP